jgi:hypothetical protein
MDALTTYTERLYWHAVGQLTYFPETAVPYITGLLVSLMVAVNALLHRTR